MPIFRLPDDEPLFPPVEMAESDGLLAVGGDLSPQRLLAAYSQGIFPWYSKGEPILWWSPDPRLVLIPQEIHIPRSLHKTMRRKTYQVTLDQAFDQVIAGCAGARAGSRGTWITPEMMDSYRLLHRLGYAHSAESWIREDGEWRLAGGLYGIALGRGFFGESMFTHRPDASKVAFATLVEKLSEKQFTLIDCQVTTEHLLRFGAKEVPREAFMSALGLALSHTISAQYWQEWLPLPDNFSSP